MQTYIVLLSGIAAMLFSASCSESDSPSTDLIADTSAGETSRVEILIPQNITRTHISDDGDERAVVEWDEGDQLVMWSKAVTGGSALSAPATFTYLAPAIDEEKGILFYCKEITIPANQSNYTYYAVSPVPESMAGAEATYTVPATQHGTFDEVPDILRAPAVEAKCLTKNIRNPINFAFEHVLHAMKITLPDVPFEEGIKTLRVEFPYAVAGKLTVNAETGEARISGNESKVVTLTFDTPKKAGDTFWVVVAPAPNGSEEVADVHFTAANADGTQFTFPTPHEAGSGTFKYDELTGGRITPVKLHLTLRPQVDFTVKITENHLGEPITGITLTLPEGYSTPSLIPGNSIVHPTLQGSETFTVKLFADEVEKLGGKTLTAVLESQHAEGFEVSNTVANKSLSLSAPYLFFEDFSGTTTSYEYHTEHETSDSQDPNPITLDNYGLSDWTGTRVGISAGVGIRIQSRVECGMGIANHLQGRTESAPISHIKSNTSVKVSVSYDYATDRYNASGGKSGNPLITFGYTEKTGTAKAGDDNFLTTLFNNKEITALDCDNGNDEKYYGHTTHTEQNLIIETCSQKTRLGWRISNNRKGAFAANGVYRLYIDNVRVSIVP